MTTDRSAWLAERRTGIGGSDVAPILGLSKWRTPMDVYLDKRGEGIDQDDNPAMFWGRALEPVIRQRYADVTGREVVTPAAMLRHPTHTHMCANLDGVADSRVVEIKTARTADGWGEDGSDEIPEAYLLQVQHYMIVTALPVADVAVLIGGQDFRLYEVPADPELQAMMIEAEAEFWQRVLDALPPEPTSYADAMQRFGRSGATGAVVASAKAEAACMELRRVKDAIAALEIDEAALKTILLREFGDAGDVLVTPEGNTLATWKLAKAAARFDTAAFKAAHPDLYSQFTRAGDPSRRLLLKEIAA